VQSRGFSELVKEYPVASDGVVSAHCIMGWIETYQKDYSYFLWNLFLKWYFFHFHEVNVSKNKHFHSLWLNFLRWSTCIGCFWKVLFLIYFICFLLFIY
jgi:hypothetical protein